MHQSNLTSIIVDPTPSRFIKSTQHGSQMCASTFEDFRDNINFFLNWFTVEN
jgi:hypothetical protein